MKSIIAEIWKQTQAEKRGGKWYLVHNGEIVEACESYEAATDLLNEYDIEGMADLEIYHESARIRT